MTENASGSDDGRAPDTEPAGRDQPPTERKMQWGFVAVPAAALVVGLVLGGLIVGVGTGGDSAPDAAETVTVTPTANSTDDTAVIVPKECVQAAESLQEATQLIRDSLSAIQSFQSNKIVDMLNQLEDLTNQATDQAQTCSDISVTPTTDTASPTS